MPGSFSIPISDNLACAVNVNITAGLYLAYQAVQKQQSRLRTPARAAVGAAFVITSFYTLAFGLINVLAVMGTVLVFTMPAMLPLPWMTLAPAFCVIATIAAARRLRLMPVYRDGNTGWPFRPPAMADGRARRLCRDRSDRTATLVYAPSDGGGARIGRIPGHGGRPFAAAVGRGVDSARRVFSGGKGNRQRGRHHRVDRCPDRGFLAAEVPSSHQRRQEPGVLLQSHGKIFH